MSKIPFKLKKNVEILFPRKFYSTPPLLINFFNSLNLYKNNFRSTLTISFTANFSHDLVPISFKPILLKNYTRRFDGIMAIIKRKKKKGEKGGGESKETEKKKR